LSIEDDIVFIERCPTLRVLGREALRILAIGAESRYVHQGEVLFLAGEASDSGFIIQEGSFRLDSNTKALGEVVIGAGALLGELALIAETKRPATATANEPSTVIRISRSLFLKMLEGYPQAAHVLRDQIMLRAQQALVDMGDVRALLDTSTPPAG
jgi:CRP-like cAMP-binding protein